MHIQGEASQIGNMLTWCHKGPPGARVDHVEMDDVNPSDEYKSFNIRYY